MDTKSTWHGLSGTAIYRCWVGMHRRCNDPTEPSYRWYGARGIKVCARWNSLHAFLEDMGHPGPGQSIDRIDSDGDYEPDNCRWATQEQQNENTGRNVYLEWQGRSQTIKAWAEELDLDPRRISERIRRGWSVEQALMTPTPRGFADARAGDMERARQLWADRGRRYRANSRGRHQEPAVVTSRRKRAPQRTNGRLTPEKLQQIAELRATGMTCRAIAAAVGLSKSSVAVAMR